MSAASLSSFHDFVARLDMAIRLQKSESERRSTVAAKATQCLLERQQRLFAFEALMARSNHAIQSGRSAAGTKGFGRVRSTAVSQQFGWGIAMNGNVTIPPPSGRPTEARPMRDEAKNPDAKLQNSSFADALAATQTGDAPERESKPSAQPVLNTRNEALESPVESVDYGASSMQ